MGDSDLAMLALSVAGGAISVALAAIALAHSAVRRVRRVEGSIHPSEDPPPQRVNWFRGIVQSLRPGRATPPPPPLRIPRYPLPPPPPPRGSDPDDTPPRRRPLPPE